MTVAVLSSAALFQARDLVSSDLSSQALCQSDPLDEVANDLQNMKGDALGVKRYRATASDAHNQASHHIAAFVERSLVDHVNVPVYSDRSDGSDGSDSSDSSAALRNPQSTQQVSDESQPASMASRRLIHQSLAALNSSGSSGGSPIGATQQLSHEPSPRSAASLPSAT